MLEQDEKIHHADRIDQHWEPRLRQVFQKKMVYRRLIFNLIVARRIRKNGYCCQDVVVVVHPVRYAISDSFTITPKKNEWEEIVRDVYDSIPTRSILFLFFF